MIAVDVESIYLAADSLECLRRTRMMLQQIPSHSITGPIVYPFEKLDTLNFEWYRISSRVQCIQLPMRTKRRALHLAGCRVVATEGSITKMDALESLELTDMYLPRSVMIGILSSKVLENLRRLVIHDLGSSEDFYGSWSPRGLAEPNLYNTPSAVVQALAQYVSDLETLGYSGDLEEQEDWVDSFGSFTSLSNLQTLRLDVDRLLYADGTEDS